MARAWAYGVLHDAHEVVLGDCVWRKKPDWVHEMADKIDRAVWDACGLSWISYDTMEYRMVKDCDMAARFFETEFHGGEFFRGFDRIGDTGAWFRPGEPDVLRLGRGFMRNMYSDIGYTCVPVNTSHRKIDRKLSAVMLNCIHWFELLFRGEYLLAFKGFMQKAWNYNRESKLFDGIEI